MKAIVKVNLNIRTGAPEIRPDNNPGYYIPGDIIEIKEKVFGASYKGNNIWYQVDNGSYVWSGGVDASSIDNAVKLERPASFINYNSIIPDIPDEIRNTKGKKTTIAILDTGCAATVSDLQRQIKGRHDAYGGSTNAEDIATDSHGTFIAGLICGNEKIAGIAAEAEIIVVRILESGIVNSSKSVKEGLEWLLKNHPNIDVVSMSFYFNPAGYETVFDNIFSGFGQQTVFISAAGENEKLYGAKIVFPARHDACFSAGALSPKVLSDYGTSTINKQVDIVFPDFNYTSYSKNNSTRQGKGSSYATAITSGLMALIISHKKEKKISYDRASLLQSLMDISGNLDALYFSSDILKPYKK
jgi:hypothetical protein